MRRLGTPPAHLLPNSTTKRNLYSKELSSIIHNQLLSGEAHLLETLGIRCWDLSASDTGRRRLEEVESVFAGEGHDFGADAERREVGGDAEHVAGFLDGFDNGFDVEGLDGAQVEDFGFDAVLLLEHLGGDEGLADAAGEGDDGEVLAGALDLGFSELRLGVRIGGALRGGESLRE